MIKNMQKKLFVHELTREAFRERLEGDPKLVVLIPVGAIEQHGPHLPLGVDILAAKDICEDVARRTDSLVAFVCLPGFSPHHMEYSGTITFRSKTLMNVLFDTIESLAHHSVKRMMLVNGHGGNEQILQYVARMARRTTGAIVAAMSISLRYTKTQEDKENTRRRTLLMDNHGGPQSGTARTLWLHPDLVEMERVKYWKPGMKLDPALDALRDIDRSDSQIARQILSLYMFDTHEIDPTGVYGFADPNDYDLEQAKRSFENRVQYIVDFIDLWRTIPDIPREPYPRKDYRRFV